MPETTQLELFDSAGASVASPDPRMAQVRPGALATAGVPIPGRCPVTGCRHYQSETGGLCAHPEARLPAADRGGVREEQPVERGAGDPYVDGTGTARRGRDRHHRGGCCGSEACRCPGGKIAKKSLYG